MEFLDGLCDLAGRTATTLGLQDPPVVMFGLAIFWVIILLKHLRWHGFLRSTIITGFALAICFAGAMVYFQLTSWPT